MADEITADLARAARAREARERRDHDPRWRELVHGELAPHEQAALRAEAEAPDAPERARRAYEAFRPLDADFRARMTATIGRELAGAREQAGTSPTSTQPASADSAGTEPAGTEPAAPANDNHDPGGGRKRAQRRNAYAPALLAAAVVVLLALSASWFLPTKSMPLPDYELNLTGFVKEVRGPDQAVEGQRLRFLPGSHFALHLVAAPGVASAEAEAAVFLASEQGLERLASNDPIHLDPVGDVFTLEGRIGQELQPPSGDFELWAVVGPPGGQPTLEELRALHAAGMRSPPPDSAWQLLTGRVSFSSDP